MTTAVTVLAALVLDAWLGEPRRCHPLVGFGRLAQGLERCVHADSVVRGAIAAALMLAPVTALAMLIHSLSWGVAIDALVLYLALGGRSLVEHAGRVRDALCADDRGAAQRLLGLMVSRDTSEMDREGAAKAAVESVLENGSDAVLAAVFWFALAGAPGVVLHRLTNTLDAMWGYRCVRYRRFGSAAARLDDVLNYMPARLTAASYALVGDPLGGLRCWRDQGVNWKSPNAGAVMAAGAGSLGLVLGGPAIYHGAIQERPILGEGQNARPEDIDRALRLVRRALWLWLLILFATGWFIDHVVKG